MAVEARPVFLVLRGVTADAARVEACVDLARELWPEARVEMPAYVRRWRGVRGVGRWLDAWTKANLRPGDQVFVLAYILGGAALAYAPDLTSRVRRLVVLRSGYQEALVRVLRRRFIPLLAPLVFGRAVADLGARPFWPPTFAPRCPTLVLVETRPSRMAERFGVHPLSDEEMGLPPDRVSVGIDHDFAYNSRTLMNTAVDWLRVGVGVQGPNENGKDRAPSKK